MSEWKDTLHVEGQGLKAEVPVRLAHLAQRPATAADFETTLAIKKQALGQYIAQVWGWDDAFQRAYHVEHFNPDHTALLEVAGRQAGLLEVAEAADRLFIQSLLLLPEFQSQGIGTYLLAQLMARAKAANKLLLLDVLRINSRALRLYQRLGFAISNTTELTFQMVYSVQHEIS
ncbi:MAG: GNAT family N-acetyltransferase [Hymenobacter sp.]|nr:GNAT family N-acetyltransferase [Hymenobacter sp.]